MAELKIVGTLTLQFGGEMASRINDVLPLPLGIRNLGPFWTYRRRRSRVVTVTLGRCSEFLQGLVLTFNDYSEGKSESIPMILTSIVNTRTETRPTGTSMYGSSTRASSTVCCFSASQQRVLLQSKATVRPREVKES